MKKIIVLLMAVCLTLSLMVGCGESDKNDNGSTGGNTDSSVTVSDTNSVNGSETDTSNENSAVSSTPTDSEILDWWGNVSIEVEAGN